MATKRDKRVKEIEEVKSKLPELGYIIHISSKSTFHSVSSYEVANNIISVITGEHYIPELGSRYTFAAYSSDKKLSKICKISVFSIIHKNYN